MPEPPARMMPFMGASLSSRIRLAEMRRLTPPRGRTRRRTIFGGWRTHLPFLVSATSITVCRLSSRHQEVVGDAQLFGWRIRLLGALDACPRTTQTIARRPGTRFINAPAKEPRRRLVAHHAIETSKVGRMGSSTVARGT